MELMTRIRVSMPNDTAFDIEVTPEDWGEQIAWITFMGATWNVV